MVDKKFKKPTKIEPAKEPVETVNVEMKEYYCEACSTWFPIKIDLDGDLVSVTHPGCGRVSPFKKENLR